MKKEYLKIQGIPVILLGETSTKVCLYIHGQGGNKEEATCFSEIVYSSGWQVLSLDLPEHGDRKSDETLFTPWQVIPELRKVMKYAELRWQEIALYANSIGAWFCLLGLTDRPLKHALFVSPVLDMNRLIENMMKCAGIIESRLEEERVIPTAFGQTLSWEYLLYVREHPVVNWNVPTSILYAGKDQLTERFIVNDFVERFNCELTVMEDGEHWFHTPEQLGILIQWVKNRLK